MCRIIYLLQIREGGIMVKVWKIALSLVFASLLVLPSIAFAHFLGYDSVDAGEIRYGSSTIYTTARSHAVSTWNTLGSINIAADTATTYEDVTFLDASRSDVSWDGLYTNTDGSDEIYLNKYYLSGYTSTQQKAVAAHELGHALGLAHSYSPNLMNPCSTCSGVTTPQSHDRSDYYSLW